MSVSASIITEIKQDVLLVSNSSVKSSNGTNYVEMLENAAALNNLSASVSNAGISSSTPPKQQAIEIGLSNDSMTEVASGLKEGDQVIVRTITPSTGTNQASSGQSIFQASTRTTGPNTGFPRD